MALEAGMHYIEIGTIVFTRNPTVCKSPRADKPMARSRNLTATITQSWDIEDSDQDVHIEWANLDKTQLDLLKVYYKAKESVTYKDVYGVSYTVEVSNLDATRRRFIDEQGFRVVLDMVLV